MAKKNDIKVDGIKPEGEGNNINELRNKEKEDTIKLKYVSRGNFKKYGMKWTFGIIKSVPHVEAVVLLGIYPKRFKKIK